MKNTRCISISYDELNSQIIECKNITNLKY